ncbi:MAG TPA: FAD binding domain-containing protein [Candidatus Baltobacteraceae bacterium]
MMYSSYLRPTTEAEALRLLGEHGADARMVSGGTDVLVELQRGIKLTQTLIDITALDALKYVRREGDEIAIGGLATHNDVLASRDARDRALSLYQACAEVGAPQIRTRGTLAGNLVTASPANDTIAPLVALGASVVLRSERGERTVDIAEFFTGFRTTVMAPDELLVEIRVRATRPDERSIFLKLGLRRAQAISVIALAAGVALESDGRVQCARIAIGCVAPTIVRVPEAEAFLAGKKLDDATIALAATIASGEVRPIADVRGSAEYRKETVAVYVIEALERMRDGKQAENLPREPVLLDTGERSAGAPAFAGTIDATINGQPRQLEGAATKTLLNALRENAGLTGAKEGCAEGECGACTVWIDGAAVMSCLVPAPQIHGKSVTTIEGLAEGEHLHPLQQAYIDNAAVQCGFCIPGMLMAGAKGLQEFPSATLEQHQQAISGNLCRCTGYRKILDAMISCNDTAAVARAGRPKA